LLEREVFVGEIVDFANALSDEERVTLGSFDVRATAIGIDEKKPFGWQVLETVLLMARPAANFWRVQGARPTNILVLCLSLVRRGFLRGGRKFQTDVQRKAAHFDNPLQGFKPHAVCATNGFRDRGFADFGASRDFGVG
jgi:hypothetical protein